MAGEATLENAFLGGDGRESLAFGQPRFVLFVLPKEPGTWERIANY